MHCKIPVIGVLGNHDHHTNQIDELKKILASAKFKFLDDEIFNYKDIGFAGVKGYGGGFGRFMLGLFGEEATKAFVSEAVNEALRLENALKRLKTEKKVVVMHYSPIQETIEGEPLEIQPFLGCSRFAEVIDRFEGIQCVVHGHAHFAEHAGHTGKGVPVYNVSYEVLKKSNNQTYFMFEV
jgi:uncharacterized protein